MNPPPPDPWNDQPHHATDECLPWHCFYHHVDEPSWGYRVCGECAHTFLTATELVWAYLSNAPPQLPFEDIVADEINFCPLCLHDF